MKKNKTDFRDKPWFQAFMAAIFGLVTLWFTFSEFQQKFNNPEHKVLYAPIIVALLFSAHYYNQYCIKKGYTTGLREEQIP